MKHLDNNLTVTFTVTTRMRFALELLCRKRKMQISSVIKEALELHLRSDWRDSFFKIWDEDEVTRVKKIQELAPELFTYEDDLFLGLKMFGLEEQ